MRYFLIGLFLLSSVATAQLVPVRAEITVDKLIEVAVDMTEEIDSKYFFLVVPRCDYADTRSFSGVVVRKEDGLTLVVESTKTYKDLEELFLSHYGEELPPLVSQSQFLHHQMNSVCR